MRSLSLNQPTQTPERNDPVTPERPRDHLFGQQRVPGRLPHDRMGQPRPLAQGGFVGPPEVVERPPRCRAGPPGGIGRVVLSNDARREALARLREVPLCGAQPGRLLLALGRNRTECAAAFLYRFILQLVGFLTS